MVCVAASYSDGSIDGQSGIHSGFTPEGLSRISAMCPPSSRTVTRSVPFSMLQARRLRNIYWNVVSAIRPAALFRGRQIGLVRSSKWYRNSPNGSTS